MATGSLRAGPRVRSEDGVDIATWDLGGSGPPLLLTHGNGFCGAMWASAAPILGRRFRLWALDQRGHGHSGRAAELSSYEEWTRFGRDLLAVVDAIGARPEDGVYGAGHSLGGAGLLLAEHLRPGTFRALYCYEPIVFPPEMRADGGQDQRALIEGALRRRRSFASVTAARANFAGKRPFSRFRPDVLDAYVSGAFVPVDEHVELACPPEVEAAVYAGALRTALWEDLSGLAVPVTVAAGGDGSALAGLARRVAATLPNARFERWEGLDHFGPMEDPDGLADAIVTALITPAR